MAELRAVWRSPLVRILQRDPREVERRAARFDITTDEGHRLVVDIGLAFFGGYNAMLRGKTLEEVARQGMRIEAHFRPFFFEGAAMGYLPRGYLYAGFTAKNAEQDLLQMSPQFRYLYYVGLGFWFGARYRRRASALLGLAPHLDPMYFPLCFDGLGFKLGFYDYSAGESLGRLLERCPAQHRDVAHQGAGRALFFVHMNNEEGFRHACETVDPGCRQDLEFGRSLALTFTQLSHPERILSHLDAASGEDEHATRLTGVTWALTAREMNDPEYFRKCLGQLPDHSRELLCRLPALCRDALSRSGSYREWQGKTRTAVVQEYSHHRSQRTEATRDR